MRAPTFWANRTPSPAAHLLRPLGALYGAVAARRLRRPGARAALPVVCVGNFTAGGAGKTPTALALGRLLVAMGHRPAFLSRGYGGRLAGPVQVDRDRHTPAEVGDEPLLLARTASTVVSRDRPAGARLCLELGATVVVMDDGLQNPSLTKDLALAVVDGPSGIGNGLCLPAGPLRAPMEAQWPLVGGVVIVEGEAGEEVARSAAARDKTVVRASLQPDARAAAGLRGQRVLAFAGIARPEKFFRALRECGAAVVRTEAFPDHHAYTAAELGALTQQARAEGLRLVTTEKDMVKIERLVQPPQDGIIGLPVTLVFSDEAPIRSMLRKVCG
jgi:tetraacyldisaccharide 4'-kinase